MKNKRRFLFLVGLLLLAIPSGAQYGQTPPLHVDGKYLKDPHGNVVNLHGVMDTPNPYFNNYRWGNTCDNTTITKCKTYFTKLFTAITDKSSGAWCNIFRLHLDPCWTNDPNKPQTGDETGEANISRYSSVRLRNYLKLLFVPIARSAVGKGLYVVMRPPGVCPKTIQVGGEYQQYLLDVWDNVSKNADVRAYAGQISLELANEPIQCLAADGTESASALHDFFQPIVDKIRANGFTGIIWIPGTSYQSNYRAYAAHPIEGYNIGYAVHVYPGWYGASDDSYNHSSFITQFGNAVPVAQTHPILISEVDWSPEKEGEGKYNEFGEWVPANHGTWGTASTSKWGNAYKAVLDYYGNISMTLTGTADYIDIDAYINNKKVIPAFDGNPECCAQACFDWYRDYAQVDAPRPAFTRQWTADNGDGTFTNPLLNADFPDPDIIRVDDTYYMVSTTMFYFPGATILKSKDLVNWEYCSNPLQQINSSDPYNLQNGYNHYAKGQWAASLKYHDGKFYLHFIAFNHENFQDGGDFLLTAENPEGTWEMRKLDGFYYDAGLLFDDGENGTGNTYIAYGIGDISVTQLDEDFKAVRTEKVISVGNGCEGSHMYHIGNYYYIYATYGGTEGSQTIFRSTSPFGPYEEHEGRIFEKQGIHQGGLVQTQTGEWWTILFKDAGTIGRIPYLEPVEWVDGWPVLGNAGRDVSEGGASYTKPNVGTSYPQSYLPTNDTFTQPSLGMQWQWNHNPDASCWSLFARPGHLRLYTASVTDNLKQAQGMLTQRMWGYNPAGTDANSYTDTYGTASFDLSGMQDGDVCGLCVFQDPYGYVGVKMENGRRQIVQYRSSYEQNGTVTDAVEIEGAEVGEQVFLRAVADFGTNKVRFYFSEDNMNYQPVGEEMTMRYTLNVFTGNRFGLFNYATVERGGYVDIDWFSTEPEYSEERYYAEGTLTTFTEDDLTMSELRTGATELNLLLADKAALDMTAVFRSGRTDDVAALCSYEISNPNIISIEGGYVKGMTEGVADVTASYTDFMGQTMSVNFRVVVAAFPLTSTGFNPSIYATGKFVENTGAFTSGQYGFGGWQYGAGLDLSAYKYVVVRLSRSATCSPSFRLFDATSYWSTPYMRDMGTSKEAVIDLKNMKKSDGTYCDPSHIYIAGFWTMGGSPVYIKEVFLSNDGKTPVHIEQAAEEGLTVVSETYYTLSGQKVSEPFRGMNIVRQTFSDGSVRSVKRLIK